MQLLFDIVDVNFNLPTTLQVYIFLFFLISTFILLIHVKPILDKLYSKTPFYWFLILLGVNLINILFTLYHYNIRSGTFKGEQGDTGERGDIGNVGDYTKCTQCDEKISLDVHRRYDKLENIYINGEVGEVRRPFIRYGYSSLGDMIISRKELTNKNLKQGYVVSGTTLSLPTDFNLIASIPAIKMMVKNPIYIWRPVPPKDFIALGDIITSTNRKPPKTSVACIPMDCVREMKLDDKFMSYKFLYQNMRPGKENDYIFLSFWDTPMNTFYANFPSFGEGGKPTIFNHNLFYNIVSGNEDYIKFDDKSGTYERDIKKENKIRQLFKKLISPVDMNSRRQNLGKTGYYRLDEHKNVTSLWQAIHHFFPGDFNYRISINTDGDIRGGKRLNDIQTKILKYAQAWIAPNKPMYVIHNKCLMKNRIDHEKKELIMKIKSLYTEFSYMMRKYGYEQPNLVEYLSSHFMRLEKQMRHIPDFSVKVSEEDFTHFGINRLKYYHKELRTLNNAILKMTNEVPKDRRLKYFGLIEALKKYDETKLKFDKNLDNDICKRNTNSIKNLGEEFNEIWDKIRALFLGDKNFKYKLKNKNFEGMSDSKIQKVTQHLNTISQKMNQYIVQNCH